MDTHFAIMLINSCNEIYQADEKRISDGFLSVSAFVSIRFSGYGLKRIENAAKKI